MAIDADNLLAIAAELKTLDQHREALLAELVRLAQGIHAGSSIASRRSVRPLSSRNPVGRRAATPTRRGPGRPLGSRNQAKLAGSGHDRGRRSGITLDIVEFLKSSGGAYTASEILAGLKIPKSKSKLTTISTTLTRLTKEGRAKKDAKRGYRAS